MPTAILASTVQKPHQLLLLNSSSTPALSPLWKQHAGPSQKSFITTLDDSDYPHMFREEHVPMHKQKGSIDGDVIHIQSPHPDDTYIQLGGSASRGLRPLGAELGWFGAQIETLSHRPLAIEIGILDKRGREGRVRLETSRKEPSLLAKEEPPLLRLSLALPESVVTSWKEVVLPLAPLLALFRTLASDDAAEDDPEAESRKRPRVALPDLPDGQFASVSYVRIYANCRLKRVWLSERGGVPDGWELRGAD